MASSARSVRSIDMPARHAEGVYLVAQGDTRVPGADEVSTSWERSANKHGVNPDSSDAPRILTSYELREVREPLDQLTLSAQDEIDRLYKVVREAGYTLLFCNTAGVAVEHRGDESDASRFRYWGTWLGGVWSEAIEGTNGIGTCIAEERPVTIHRTQHYRTRHVDLSCSGAPAFGADGQSMAVLDVSAIDIAGGRGRPPRPAWSGGGALASGCRRRHEFRTDAAGDRLFEDAVDLVHRRLVERPAH